MLALEQTQDKSAIIATLKGQGLQGQDLPQLTGKKPFTQFLAQLKEQSELVSKPGLVRLESEIGVKEHGAFLTGEEGGTPVDSQSVNFAYQIKAEAGKNSISEIAGELKLNKPFASSSGQASLEILGDSSVPLNSRQTNVTVLTALVEKLQSQYPEIGRQSEKQVYSSLVKGLLPDMSEKEVISQLKGNLQQLTENAGMVSEIKVNVAHFAPDLQADGTVDELESFGPQVRQKILEVEIKVDSDTVPKTISSDNTQVEKVSGPNVSADLVQKKRSQNENVAIKKETASAFNAVQQMNAAQQLTQAEHDNVFASQGETVIKAQQASAQDIENRPVSSQKQEDREFPCTRIPAAEAGQAEAVDQTLTQEVVSQKVTEADKTHSERRAMESKFNHSDQDNKRETAVNARLDAGNGAESEPGSSSKVPDSKEQSNPEDAAFMQTDRVQAENSLSARENGAQKTGAVNASGSINDSQPSQPVQEELNFNYRALHVENIEGAESVESNRSFNKAAQTVFSKNDAAANGVQENTANDSENDDEFSLIIPETEITGSEKTHSEADKVAVSSVLNHSIKQHSPEPAQVSQQVDEEKQNLQPAVQVSANGQVGVAAQSATTGAGAVAGNANAATANWSTNVSSEAGGNSAGGQGASSGNPSQQQGQPSNSSAQNAFAQASQQRMDLEVGARQQAQTRAADETLQKASALMDGGSDALSGERRASLPPSMQTIPLPVRSPQWGQAFGQRVNYMINAQVQQAQITLNPEKLGPIQIKLHFDREQQVQLSVVAQHGTTRDAIDASIPRLREMLEQSGVSLASVDVSTGDSFADQQGSEDERFQSTDNLKQSGRGAVAEAEEELESLVTSDSLVDFYA